MEKIKKAVQILKHSRFTTAFTGAGISVESGIPPFRGKDGIWNKYDPEALDISYFTENPEHSWMIIKELFYDYYNSAKPNPAHLALARMEREGLLGRVITQNIDNLHQEAGSRMVFEFHGNLTKLKCLSCFKKYNVPEISLDHLPPTCRECGGILKPDFVFFGESIPQDALMASYEAAGLSDVFLIIGTTGEVMPANQIPPLAKQNGAIIVEINPEPSHYTNMVTDLYLQGKASEIMKEIEKGLFPASLDNDQYRID
ncbi:MAG: NAD-dependent deacylase [Bacteroidales bacterium]|nr:NAD-dependent deacylase [Bacteroidales bacterium]